MTHRHKPDDRISSVDKTFRGPRDGAQLPLRKIATRHTGQQLGFISEGSARRREISVSARHCRALHCCFVPPAGNDARFIILQLFQICVASPKGLSVARNSIKSLSQHVCFGLLPVVFKGGFMSRHKSGTTKFRAGLQFQAPQVGVGCPTIKQQQGTPPERYSSRCGESPHSRVSSCHGRSVESTELHRRAHRMLNALGFVPRA